jgi:hypothetical protein
MSDEEKLFALMAIAEEHQAAAKSAIDVLVAEQAKFAQQRIAIAKIIRDLSHASETAAGAMERAAGASLQDAADKSVALVSHAVAEAFKRSLSPAVANLSAIVDSAAAAEHQIRNALANFSWRSMLLVCGVVFGVLLLIWFVSMVSITWQRYQIDSLSQQRAALEAEISVLQAQSNDLAKRGGRAKLNVCGTESRLCVQVDKRWGFGKNGDYFILKGY